MQTCVGTARRRNQGPIQMHAAKGIRRALRTRANAGWNVQPRNSALPTGPESSRQTGNFHLVHRRGDNRGIAHRVLFPGAFGIYFTRENFFQSRSNQMRGLSSRCRKRPGALVEDGVCGESGAARICQTGRARWAGDDANRPIVSALPHASQFSPAKCRLGFIVFRVSSGTSRQRSHARAEQRELHRLPRR